MDHTRALSAGLNFIDRYEFEAGVMPLLDDGDVVAGREMPLAAPSDDVLHEIIAEYALVSAPVLWVGRLYFYGVHYQMGTLTHISFLLIV